MRKKNWLFSYSTLFVEIITDDSGAVWWQYACICVFPLILAFVRFCANEAWSDKNTVSEWWRHCISRVSVSQCSIYKTNQWLFRKTKCNIILVCRHYQYNSWSFEWNWTLVLMRKWKSAHTSNTKTKKGIIQLNGFRCDINFDLCKIFGFCECFVIWRQHNI